MNYRAIVRELMPPVLMRTARALRLAAAEPTESVLTVTDDDYPALISTWRLEQILFWHRELREMQHVPGSIVEFGVARGTSLGILAHLDEIVRPIRTIAGFDTFTGFPDHDAMSRSAFVSDRAHSGRFRCNSLDMVRQRLHPHIERRHVPGFYLIAGDILDTLPPYLAANPNRIAIAVLDVDVAATTRFALEHIWPYMSPGGRVYIDGYSFAGLTETIGVDEFVATLPPGTVRIDRTDITNPSAFFRVPFAATGR